MFDDLDDKNYQHASVQRAEQEAIKKSRRPYGQRDKNHPDDQAILIFKLRLDKLQRERQYKNAALAARNALLIERDETAREEHRRTHKTDEQLLEEWRNLREEKFREERHAFELDEVGALRTSVADEWLWGWKCLEIDYKTTFNTLSLERDLAKFRRKARHESEMQARKQSSSEALQRQYKLHMESWAEVAATVGRDERAARRNIAVGFPESERQALAACAAREKLDAEKSLRVKAEQAAKLEHELNEAVDDMEGELLRRMSQLSAKFKSTGGGALAATERSFEVDDAKDSARRNSANAVPNLGSWAAFAAAAQAKRNKPAIDSESDDEDFDDDD